MKIQMQFKLVNIESSLMDFILLAEGFYQDVGQVLPLKLSQETARKSQPLPLIQSSTHHFIVNSPGTSRPLTPDTDQAFSSHTAASQVWPLPGTILTMNTGGSCEVVNKVSRRVSSL